MQVILRFIERYWAMLALCVGAVTYGIIMLLSIGQSIWFDEGYSILLAKRSFGDLLALTAVDAHPPLYYMLLKVWGEVFGFSEFALRSLSAVLTGGAVAVSLVLVKRLFGLRVAMVAIPALLLAPFVLRYGYEVRMYALATFIGVSATYALVRAWYSDKKVSMWWILYAVLVALGMYTLYMTIALWVAHVVWLVWVSIKEKKKLKQWQWVYAFVGAIILFVPYMMTFFSQLANSVLPGVGNEVSLTVLADVIAVLTIFTPGWQVGGWATLLIVAMVTVLFIAGMRVFRKAKGRERQNLLLCAFLAVVPIAFFALTSLPPREPIFVVRYMAHVSIWLYLFAAVIIAIAWKKVSRRMAMIGGALLVVTLGVGMYNLVQRGNYIFERDQTPETHKLRAAVTCDDDTIVVADDPYTFIDETFYFSDCDMTFYAKDNVENKGGYAPLHDSTQRIAKASDIKAVRLIHLHWGEPSLKVDSRYVQINRQVYGKQYVDTYKLSEE